MNLVGARWWKFDIHTHTPASFDYGKGDLTLQNITPREWLEKFIEKGIECVAITDHNSGDWIDRLKVSAEELRQEGNEIHVFPGVEVTANSNIHVLGIFDPSCSSTEIDTVIARSRYDGERGNSNAVAQESAEKIIQEIKSAGGIAIPAHIDMKAGLCTQSSAHTIKQICK
ncbi:PHP domain-containing protein, partial [Psychrobacter celer]